MKEKALNKTRRHGNEANLETNLTFDGGKTTKDCIFQGKIVFFFAGGFVLIGV